MKNVKMLILSMIMMGGTVFGMDLDAQENNIPDSSLAEFFVLFSRCECLSGAEGDSQMDLIRQAYDTKSMDPKTSRDLFIQLTQMKDRNGDFLFEGVQKKAERDSENNAFCAKIHEMCNWQIRKMETEDLMKNKNEELIQELVKLHWQKKIIK